MRVVVQVAPDAAAEEPPAAREFARWADAVARRPDEVCVRIVGLAEGARLNARYRGRPRATNVLSFPFESPRQTRPPCLGDIVLTAQVVRAEARAAGREARAHWAHLFVHGLLHLLGHDHRDDAEAARMEAAEARALAALGWPPENGRAGGRDDNERAGRRDNNERADRRDAARAPASAWTTSPR